MHDGCTIAQIGLGSTPGLPKQANKDTLNSHEASNVPQHGRPLEEKRGCLSALLPRQAGRLDQSIKAGRGSAFLRL